jgi:phage tail tape-measure protein
MQEIGLWMTPEGTVPARMQLESTQGDVTVTELPSWASGALQGAAAGAATGLAAGPYGALIGALAGGALGAASSATAQSSKPASQPPSISRPAGPRPAGASRNRTQVIQALQQFAAVIPSLVQLIAGSEESEQSSNEETASAAIGLDSASLKPEWGPEVLEGTWSIP